MKNKNIFNSFKYAFLGINEVLLKGRNMKVHFSIMLLVIIFGFIYKINAFEWISCLICFALVIGSEMINTAIENTVDLVTKEINQYAKLAKDIAAGAVLVNAIISSIIGFIIFIPKIL